MEKQLDLNESRRLLYSIKSAIMAMDIGSLKSEQIEEVFNNFSNVVKECGGGGSGVSYKEVIYEELKQLRDDKNLIPGCFYRITDYVTKTCESEYFGSHEHPFDIIVLALSADTLSEDAMAIQHGSESYFANNNLAAWELKYSIDAPSNVEFAPQSTNVIDSIAAQVVVDNLNYNTQYVTFTEKVDHSELDPELKEVLDNWAGIGYPYTVFQIPEGVNVYGSDSDDDDVYKVDYIVLIDWSNEGGTYFKLDGINASEQVVCDYLKYDSSQDQWDSLYNQDGAFAHQDIEIESHEQPADHKGFISYMKDEFGNECYYDFKNIGEKFWDAQETSSFKSYADVLSSNNEILHGQEVEFVLIDNELINDDESDDESDNGRGVKGEEESEKINQLLNKVIKKALNKGYKWFQPTVNGVPVTIINNVEGPKAIGNLLVVGDKVLALPTSDKKNKDVEDDEGKNSLNKHLYRNNNRRSSEEQNQEDNNKRIHKYHHLKNLNNIFKKDDENNEIRNIEIVEKGGGEVELKDEKLSPSSLLMFAGYYDDIRIFDDKTKELILMTIDIASKFYHYDFAKDLDLMVEGIALGCLYFIPNSDGKKADGENEPYPSGVVIYDVVSTSMLGYLFNKANIDIETYNITLEDYSLTGYVRNNKIEKVNFNYLDHTNLEVPFTYTSFIFYNGNDKDSFITDNVWGHEATYFSQAIWNFQGNVGGNIFNGGIFSDSEEAIIYAFESVYGNIYNPGMTLPSELSNYVQGDYNALENVPDMTQSKEIIQGGVTKGTINNQSDNTPIELAEGAIYEAGNGIDINGTTISTKDWYGTQEEFEELAHTTGYDPNTNYFIQQPEPEEEYAKAEDITASDFNDLVTNQKLVSKQFYFDTTNNKLLLALSDSTYAEIALTIV